MRLAPIIAITALAAFVAGCASDLAQRTSLSLEMPPEALADLRESRTWAWLPHPVSRINVPEGVEAGLEGAIERQIERSMREQGFRRTSGPADFYLTFHLTLQRRQRTYSLPSASYTLWSHSSSPSYVVEGSTRKTEIYQDLHLGIVAVEADGRPLWKARIARRIDHDGSPGEGTRPGVQSSVGSLLARFPAPAPREDLPGSPPDWQESPEASLAQK